MPRQSLMEVGPHRQGLAVSTAIVLLCTPEAGIAWGTNAQRLIINHAVDTLPNDLRNFSKRTAATS